MQIVVASLFTILVHSAVSGFVIARNVHTQFLPSISRTGHDVTSCSRIDADGHPAVFVRASCGVVRDPQTELRFHGKKTNDGRALNITATVAMAIALRAKW